MSLLEISKIAYISLSRFIQDLRRRGEGVDSPTPRFGLPSSDKCDPPYDFRDTRSQQSNKTLSVSNMRIYYFLTMKYTLFCFGRVSTLSRCLGFKSVIDVTLSVQVNTG